MPVPWEAPINPQQNNAPSGVPWERGLSQQYQIQGIDANSVDPMAAKASAYYDEQRRALASGRAARRGALAKIQTPEELATAYGYKPGDLKPEDLASAFDTFRSYGYNIPEAQGKGVLGSMAESAGSAITAPIGFAKQAFAHGKAAITGKPGDIKSKNAADLAARMYAEYRDTATEGHPVASATGTVIGATPWALLSPAETLPQAAATGGALGAAMPDADTGNFTLNALTRAGIGAAGGAAGHQLTKALIAGGSKIPPAITGRMPQQNAALQQSIMEGLGIPAEQITAADIVTSGGLKTKQSLISKFRDLAQASGGRLGKVNEQNLAAVESRVGDIRNQAARDLAETPFPGTGGEAGPLTPGEAVQASLPIEKRIREATITGPAYARVPAMPPDTSVPHGEFLGNLERRLGELEATGAGSPYSAPLTAQGESPIKVLQQQLANIKGLPGKAAVEPTMVWPPEVQDLISKQGFPEEIFVQQGIKKIPIGGGSPAQPGTPSMDTVYGLRQILENLKHNRQRFNTVGGSKLTHPITETINDLEATLKPVLDSPEWKNYLAAKHGADALHGTYVAPYNESLLKGLLRKPGQGAEDVLPSRAMDKITGMNPEEIQILNSFLESKGQAGLRSGLLENLAAGATNPTMPAGMQIDPKMLLQRLKDWSGRAAMTPDQATKLDKMKTALELMDQIGSRQPPISATVDPMLATSSQRSFMKAVSEYLARASDKALTSQRGKAVLLTPSATRNPELRGTALQRMLQMLESGSSGTVGLPFAGGYDNPVDKTNLQ